MKLVDWVQILVGVVILGLLIYLVQNAVDTGRSLGGLENSVEATSQRVDRIASALPDIGVRVASESVNGKASTLVLAGNASGSADGGDFYTVVDLTTGLATVYDLSLPAHERKRTFAAIAFSAREIDPSSISLDELNRMARRAGETPLHLEAVDGSTSFVLRTASWEDFAEQQLWLQGEKKPITVPTSGPRYQDLREAVAEAEKRTLQAIRGD